jgi:ABC-type cobalamin/Fe3+-siderophores transport system ATPase subunit
MGGCRVIENSSNISIEKLKTELREFVEINDNFSTLSKSINHANSANLQELIVLLSKLAECCRNYIDQVNKVVKEYTDLSDNFVELISVVLKSHKDTTLSFNNQLSNNNMRYLNYDDTRKQFLEQTIAMTDNVKRNINELELFQKLNFFDGNLVLIGANGSGKTTLVNYLKKITSNENETQLYNVNNPNNKPVNKIMVLGAQKILIIPKLKSIPTELTSPNPIYKTDMKISYDIDGSNESVIYNQDLKELAKEFGDVIQFLVFEDRETKYDKSGQTSLADKVFEQFTNITSKSLVIRSGKLLINNMYDASQLSDGEKVILFYTAHVVLAPENGFIFIDEPESFLHQSVLGKLWDNLERIRPDLKFIYITHNIRLASSRSSTKLWIKSFTHPEDGNLKPSDWEFEALPEDNCIPEELMMEILGSRRDILFVEGDESSIDKVVYEKLLGQRFLVKLVDAGGCSQVISTTRAYNAIEHKDNKAYGLIDRDFRNDDEVNELANDNIYALNVAEIENLFFTKNFLLLFAEYLHDKSNVDDLIQKVKDKFHNDSELIISKSISLILSEKSEEFKKSKTVNQLKRNMSDFSKLDIDERVTKIKNSFEELNYDGILRKFNYKGLKQLANQHFNITNFIEKAMQLLGESNEVRNELLKYIPDEFRPKQEVNNEQK